MFKQVQEICYIKKKIKQIKRGGVIWASKKQEGGVDN